MLVFESDTARSSRARRALGSAVLLSVLAAVFAWTSHAPADPILYWLWATPALAGGALLWGAHRGMVCSPLAQTQVALLSVFLLCAGSLPQGIPTAFELSGVRLVLTPERLALLRAFVIGFASALVVREILLRKSPLLPGKWLSFVVVCVCVSAFEVVGALAWAAHAGLGRPSVGVLLGAPWELVSVCVGTVISLLALTRRHDGQLLESWMELTSALDWRRAA